MRPGRMRPDRVAALLLAAAFAVLCASIVDALRIAPLPGESPAGARAGMHAATPGMVANAGASEARRVDAHAGDATADGVRGGDAAPGSGAPSVHDVERATRALLAAVARDPFRPDRRRAPDRYRMPGEAPPEVRVARRATLPPLWLVGTASFGDGGGFAALAVQGRAPLLVPVGDTLAGLRLVRVDTGSAVLEGADTVLLLELARRPVRGGRR
jgi:hypothetical protein